MGAVPPRPARQLPFCGEEPAAIEPLWDRTEGEPYLRGFRVTYDKRRAEVDLGLPVRLFQ